jgi:signal transduction histidine kinase
MTQLRVRARAVDMLGRQQIAGIPTAIHELFKNAHDAYAERVEVDFFRKNRILVLRDDGYGMTKDDVEKRWLTLGTESRVNANNVSSSKWTGPKNLQPRTIMGEKGIGRLAIAVVAPITILMSRASRPDGLHNLVVAIVHWGLFEQPGLDISEIDIPIQEYAGGTLPTREDIRKLVEKVESNLIRLESEIEKEAYEELTKSLELAKSIGPDRLDNTLNSNRGSPLTLTGESCGTHFIMLPVAPELDDDIDGGADNESSKLERNLLGFSNTMATDKPAINTEFRDHKTGDVLERIGPKSFFTTDDFTRTDQLIEGRIDSNGQFTGEVSVYGKPRNFVCNWVEGKGRPPRCGEFSIKFGYVQGNPKESKLTPEDWAVMEEKTNKIGGLYIYRDGIRILPYGNSDYDFLDIERRRSKSAKDWFFSYRRVFGYVAISHSINGTLTEKAGREGFRENQAYRDFRSILMNLFQQLAIEFFKPGALQGDDYWRGKEHYALQAELLKKQRAKADARKAVFDTELKKFSELYESNFFESNAASIKSNLEEQISYFSKELEPGDYAAKIRLLELDARQKYISLTNKNSIALPRGLSLNTRLTRDWSAYERMSQQIQSEVLEPLRLDIDKIFHSATVGRIANEDRRKIALQNIEREKDLAVKGIVSLRRDTFEASEVMHNSLKNVLQQEFSQLRASMENLVSNFTKRSVETPEKLDEIRHEIEQEVISIAKAEMQLFESFKRQMVELTEGVNSRETIDDRFAALEDRNQKLEDQIEFYTEFAQIGMSVGILQHEFEGAARGIRQGMADLKPWADSNIQLSGIYQKLRDHIEHLDGYLKVLDPLGRRMHRSTVEISGSEILTVIRRVFNETLESSSISLEPTHAFRGKFVKCKSSALLGAFINIIDNAIFWLNSRSDSDKIIKLDADATGFLISNTGPGIEERLKEQIFEFGETRKPGGRGMGLAISKQTLRREGFDIELVGSGLNTKPIFRIAPMEDSGK